MRSYKLGDRVRFVRTPRHIRSVIEPKLVGTVGTIKRVGLNGGAVVVVGDLSHNLATVAAHHSDIEHVNILGT